MFSRQRYLEDLLDFVERRVQQTADGQTIGRDQLASALFQPFGRLAEETHQDAAQRPVPQVRIAVEVLRRLLRQEEASGAAEYRQAAYDSLLRNWAVSDSELQTAKSAIENGGDEGGQLRQSLANRLGIGAERVDSFLLDPEEITEQTLEKLFGLPSTKRDPFQPREAKPQLLKWQVEHLPSSLGENGPNGANGQSPREKAEQALAQTLEAAVSAAEEETLPQLRDILLAAVSEAHNVSDPKQVADGLTRLLAVDFWNNGRVQTTRLEQAFETLQTVLFGLRTGRFAQAQRFVSLLEINPAGNWEFAFESTNYSEAKFNEDWHWLGRYETWRGAARTLVYPDGLLMPSLLEPTSPLHAPTQAFRTLIDNLRATAQLTPRRARELANRGLPGQDTFGYLKSLRNETLADRLPDTIQDRSFVITEQFSGEELVQHKSAIEAHFREAGLAVEDIDEEVPNWLKAAPNWLKEIYYFVPLLLAQHLQRSGQFVAALDWYQTIYAYHHKPSQRRIFYGLYYDEHLPLQVIRNPDNWLRQTLNPHDIASERGYAYTRYTLISLISCFIDFADAEFAHATAESLVQARNLYLTALDLLDLPEMLPPEDERAIANPLTSSGPAPLNPAIVTLRRRAETNLHKLRNGRNIAGMKRMAESDKRQESGTPGVGQDLKVVSPRPTIYRYAVLIERAKQLVGIAQQIEGSFLSALEKKDAESYSITQAKQDLELSKETVQLQNLRLNEAKTGVSLAQMQQERANLKRQRYQEMIESGLNQYEERMITEHHRTREARKVAAAYAPLKQIGSTIGSVFSGSPTAAVGQLAGSGLSLHAAFEQSKATQEAINATANAQIASVKAGFERRKQQWRLQKGLAEKDVQIGCLQITRAEQQLGIAEQERDIAQLQTDHARTAKDFLANKFTNADLYEWMSGVLSRVYSFFLQQATATAQLAQNQLAFERQERSPTIIQSDYWRPPTKTQGNVNSGEQLADRRGLTGSARLLQDIYKLDQYAFETKKRKLQLRQTFSLDRLFPFEFQQFRESGVLPFATPMELFDQDFPGHFLRLIKRIRVTIIGLIPPERGVRATLTNSGISRVVVGPDTFRTIDVRRTPELIAFTSAQEATGQFELEPEGKLLLPFEGTGVDTTWELELPKGANPFDYRTISDVLLTVEYTALHSHEYRRQVIEQLEQEIEAERSYSFRDQFPDLWYDLHNPEQSDEPLVVSFEIGRGDFPPHIENLRIDQLLLYFSPAGEKTIEIPVKHLHLRPLDVETTLEGGTAVPVDGIISTRRGNGSSWVTLLDQSPLGKWELALDRSAELDIGKLFKQEQVEDILFVITFVGQVPSWPE